MWTFALNASIMCRKGHFVLLLMCCFLFSFGQKSSVKPVSKIPPYIMHVVKFGETLTKIAKEYGVSKTDILKANPSLTADNLNPEQILRIPNSNNKKLLSDSKTEDNELKPKVVNTDQLAPKGEKYHTVLPGETMYHISKLYGVKIEDIQKWNNLKDFNVKVGTQLIVVDPAFKPKPTSYVDIPTVKKEEAEKKQTPKVGENPVEKQELSKQTLDNQGENTQSGETPDIQAADNENQKELAKLFKEKTAGGNVQITKGTGAPMTTTLGAMEKVYFAMHKTLPIGTIIKIKNLVNNKIIFAKVIGKLPEIDENKHVIVRYSLGVKKDLQLQNGKCYVQIEYPN